MSDLIQIPPIVRTVLYYVLAALGAVTAAGFIPDARWAALVSGLSALFGFTFAAQHVPAKKKADEPADEPDGFDPALPEPERAAEG